MLPGECYITVRTVCFASMALKTFKKRVLPPSLSCRALAHSHLKRNIGVSKVVFNGLILVLIF